MVDPIIIGLATQGGYAVLSFAVGYFFNKSRGLNNRRKNTECGIRTILKIELRRIHEDGMKAGCISYADEASAEEIYTTYHALGGNGQGTTMLEEIRKLPKV